MSTMQNFIKEKGLWADYCMYFVDKKINGNYIPNITKERREEKKKIAIEMYKNGSTYKIGQKKYTNKL